MLYIASSPKCLYHRFNFAYAQYRFLCSRLANVLEKINRPQYMPAVRKLLNRFIIGKAPGKYWFNFWRSRVRTRNETLHSQREDRHSDRLKRLHRNLYAKLRSHRQSRFNHTETVQATSFFRRLGRLSQHTRNYWLRSLAAQRRRLQTLSAERVQTFRRLSSQKKLASRRLRRKLSQRQSDKQNPSVQPSEKVNLKPTPTTSNFKKVLQNHVARDSAFVRWREANNVYVDDVRDDDSMSLKAAAMQKIDREYDVWRQLRRTTAPSHPNPPCYEQQQTSSSRVEA